MVSNVRRSRILCWYFGLVLLGVVAGVVFVPSVVTDRSVPYVRMVTRAVGGFFSEHGRYPESLTDAASYLREGTISHVRDYQYEVEVVDSVSNQIVRLEASYRVDANGAVEELYARVIDKHRR